MISEGTGPPTLQIPKAKLCKNCAEIVARSDECDRLRLRIDKGSKKGNVSMAHILVVDDVYTVRLKTELILRHSGCYDVESVGSGQEAIEAALATPPNAVILDIVMAGLDGFATLRALRDHQVTCPIIAYTSRRERYPGEFEARGFNAFVPKSESINGLLAVLRLLLDQEKQSRQVDCRTALHGITASQLFTSRARSQERAVNATLPMP